MNKNLKVFVMLLIAIFMCTFISVNAEETTDVDNNEIIMNSNEEDNSVEKNTDSTDTEEANTAIEVHKVAVITNKLDEYGNQLSGALLQIIDANGNIVDEWTSDRKSVV